MNLELPNGAHIQIFIGGALPDAAGDTTMPPLLAAPPTKPRRRVGRWLLQGSAGLVLIAGAFFLGQHSPGSAPRQQVASNTASPALPSAAPVAPVGMTEQHAFPDRPLPRELAQSGDGQVPAAFQRQLQQAPTVVPPPGQPASAAAGNPFGLEQ